MANTFLGDVASSLYSHYGAKISGLDIVFASRRAAIYFAHELKKFGTYSPRLYTIDKWITSLSPTSKEVEHPSKFILVSKLFSIYKERHSDETLEHFYSFGEVLLSDFDMVDRYMVDAEGLYNNTADIKELTVSLNDGDELYETAVSFWKSFDSSGADRAAELQFKKVWEQLYDLYTNFNALLDSEKLSYSGKTYRKVATACKEGELTVKRTTLFVGLNALSRSEKEILRSIDPSAVKFFWDYDPRWSDKASDFIEADYFINENLKEFPQADFFTTNIKERRDVKIEALRSPSDFMQAKITGELLRGISRDSESSTAVIFTDESLLLPLLHSIPPEITQLNISMGYPLSASKVGRLLTILLSLHSSTKYNGADDCTLKVIELRKLLYSPYTASSELSNLLSDELSVDIPSSELNEKAPSLDFLWRKGKLHRYLTTAFERLSTQEELSGEDKVFFQAMSEVLSEVQTIETHYGEELSPALYLKVLSGAVTQKRVDFEGVSGSGLQIMGILESRSLDFDRVIMLSLGDDNFPSSRPDNSYIPPVLLQCFGMPTIKDKSAIWSYYFYRLTQRSSLLSLIYCNVADNSTTGEASRYLLQLKYSSEYNYSESDVRLPSITGQPVKEIKVEKTAEMVADLKGRNFSPSALTKYMQCPLSYYYHYVAGIKELPKEDERAITPLELGNIVHNSLEKIYTHKTSSSEITALIESEIAREIGDKAQFAQSEIRMSEIIGLISNALKYDSKVTDFKDFYALEGKFSTVLSGYKLYSKIDRIDSLQDNSYRVIDYKTGSVELKVKTFDELFSIAPKKVYKEIFQILFYCLLLRDNGAKDSKITPCIYPLRQMTPQQIENFSGQISIGKVTINRPLCSDEFDEIEKGITYILDSICNREIPFSQTPYLENCTYCPYTPICRR